MAHQVLDVFKKKGSRALGGNNSRHIEKQGSLCFVGKNVGSAQGVLLAFPSAGEGLTRKARKQDIVGGDVVFIHLSDVGFPAVGGIREICQVGFLGQSSEEEPSELQSTMGSQYAGFFL